MEKLEILNIPRHRALAKIERKSEKRLASGVPREVIYDTLDRFRGNVSDCAKELSINYVDLSRYVDKDNELRSLTIRHREAILDSAEKEMTTAIENGNLSMVRFALTHLGKDRGYVQRSEKDVRTQEIPAPKSVDISKLDVDQLKQLQAIMESTEPDR